MVIYNENNEKQTEGKVSLFDLFGHPGYATVLVNAVSEDAVLTCLLKMRDLFSDLRHSNGEEDPFEQAFYGRIQEC